MLTTVSHNDNPAVVIFRDIEDITWPRRDTKFLFEC